MTPNIWNSSLLKNHGIALLLNNWKKLIRYTRYKVVLASAYNYEGRSINKLQNGAIPLILKTEKIRNIHFVGNFIQNIRWNSFIDDVITATSSVHRTVYLCIIFSVSNLS